MEERPGVKVFYIDEKIGIIDLVMDPSQPDILYAAAYEKIRLPWHYEAGGEGSAIYKTTDGGQSWKNSMVAYLRGKLAGLG